MLGVTTAELEQLAQLYQPNQTLWRMPIPHFSPWDFNTMWDCIVLGQCEAPPVKPRNRNTNSNDPANNPAESPDAPNCVSGSVINCQQQTLGEMIPIVGTSYSLHYQSNRVPGFRAANIVSIPLSNDPMRTAPELIKLQISVAGRQFEREFPSTPGLRYRFEWDGLDAYGRPVLGRQPVKIRVGYGYQMFIPTLVQVAIRNAFGTWSFATTLRRARVINYFWTEYTEHVGPWDMRGLGLGGWTLGDHHVFEVTSRRVEKGDGSAVQGPETVRSTIRTVAGITGVSGFSGDARPANKAAIAHGDDFVFGHDGALYLTGSARIRRVGTDGIIRTIAGTGSFTSSPDGSLARLTAINPLYLQFLPDGTLIFFDASLGYIRRIGADSIVRKWAGGGASTAEEASALQTSFSGIAGMQAAADGSVYYVQSARIRQITPGGLVFTVAGTGTCSLSAPLEGVAKDLAICPTGQFSIGPDGSIYFLETNSRVRRVWTDGRISHHAFGGTGSGAMGQPALNANVGTVRNFVMGPDGTLYWHDAHHNVRAVSPEGIMRQVAGNGSGGVFAVDGALATQDYSSTAGHGMRVGPDGALYVGDDVRRIRRVGSPFPGLSATDHAIASTDASEVYIFTGDGQHKKTVDATTGVTLVSFAHDSVGRLNQVVDRDSLVTTIERDAAGNPTAIVAPFGQRTLLTMDAHGMLAGVKAPATSPYTMEYNASGLLGLLEAFVEPGTGTHTFAYDSLGKLLTNTNENGTQTLARVDSTNRYRVTRSDAAGVATTHHVIGLTNGDARQVTANPSVRPDTSDYHANGNADHFLADGTSLRDGKRPDPRFGGASSFTDNLLITTPGAPQTLVLRSQGVTLGITGDLLKPQKIADTVRFGVGFNTNTSITTWDAPTRTVVFQSHLNRRDSTFLDSLGRPIRVAPRGLASATLAYDNFGRVTQAVHGGRLTRFTFDQAGLVDTVIDPLLFRTRFAYDSAGRPTTITRPDGQSIALGHDPTGRLTSIAPPGRPQHQFAYTAGGLLDTYTPPSVSGVSDPATRYSYDAAQRLTRVRRPTGDSLTFGYDAAGRPATLTFADATLTTTYHAVTGRPATVHSTSDGGQQVSFTMGGPFLNGFSQSGGGVSGSVSFSYDVQHRLAASNTTVFTSTGVNYGYDRDDLLTSVGIQAGALLLTRAPQTGLLTATSFNGVTTALTYDSLGNLTSETAERSGQGLLSYNFTRNALDRIITKTETVLGVQTDWAFAYDSAGRLSEVTRDGSVAASYVYDANGNRLSRTTSGGTELGVYDDQDRIISYGGATYLHNAAGELTYKIVGTDTTQYYYDALGALRWVTLPDGTRIDYVIDALGRRIGRKVNGAFTHRFLYESDLRIAAEVNNVGQTVTRYLYGTKVNVPEFMLRGGVTYRFITDYLGSVRLVVRTSDGVIMQQLDYDEFGRVTFNSAPGFQPFGYAGGLYDDATDIALFGERNYSARDGRWLIPDPIGFEGGSTNLYEYALADPINNSDPYGLCLQNPWWQAARRLDDQGEAAVKRAQPTLEKVTRRIPEMRNRIPDFVNRTQRVFVEVKNVNKAYYTQQIRNILEGANKLNYKVELYVRDLKDGVSESLRILERQGRIVLKEIPRN